MIAQLTGIVTQVSATHLIIDVQGVGYLVHTSKHTLSNISDGTIRLHIETIMKSEQLSLYGFLTDEEQSCFNLLITVQGVGPKMGISILSSLTPEQVMRGIHMQDHTEFTQADGVGPKLAQRIVRELKGKSIHKNTSHLPGALPSKPTDTRHNDATSALLNLGYKRHEAETALRNIPDMTDMSISDIITSALKLLDRKIT